MEFKTCEERVLAELDTAEKKVEVLEGQVEDLKEEKSELEKRAVLAEDRLDKVLRLLLKDNNLDVNDKRIYIQGGYCHGEKSSWYDAEEQEVYPILEEYALKLQAENEAKNKEKEGE